MGRGAWLAVAVVVLAPVPVLADEANVEEIRERGQLAMIRERGRLIVAVKDNVRPLAFRNDAGELQGLEIEIARRLAAELLGDPEAVEFVPVPNRERLPAVTAGKVDLAIARLSVTASRSRLVDFSAHYYLDATSFIARRDSAVGSLSDLARARVAVLEESSTIAAVRSRLPQADLVGVESYEAALALLAADEAAAFAGDRSVLVGWMQEHPQYRVLDARVWPQALAIAMPKGLQASRLRLAVNAALSRWREDGWVARALRRWELAGGSRGDRPSADPNAERD